MPNYNHNCSLSFRRFLLVFGLLISTAIIGSVESGETGRFGDFYQPLQPPRSVQVIAHRGLAEAAPENTLPTVQGAIEAGFEWVEVDIRRSRDGAHVILHDSTLDRTTNGSGPVAEKTLQEIKTLDAGSWFARRFAGTALPTLMELLSYCKDRINLYLDCKEIDPELLIQEVREAKMERQVVAFASPEMLEKINQLSGNSIPIMPSVNERLEVEYWVQRLHPAAVEMHANLLTPEIVKRFHEAGIRVQAQTLGERDNQKVWRSCLEMGVDWIQTDYGENVIWEYTRRLIGGDAPIKISAHRGANEFAPENTLAAYRKAIDLGMDFIEIDVRTTKDGRLVSLHDERLERTTNGQGLLAEKTLQELNSISVGSWFGRPYIWERIPSVGEICELIRSHPGPKGPIALYLDLKDADFSELSRILTLYGLTEHNVCYGSPDELLQLRKYYPTAQLMPGFGRAADFDAMVEKVKPFALDTQWNLLTKDFIEKSHRNNVHIFSDAMGGNEKVESYLRAIENGIDTIQTDRIPRVYRAIELAIKAKH